MVLNKLYAALGIAALVFILCGVIYLQHGRNNLLRAELAQAVAANRASTDAIKILLSDAAAAGKSCEKRIAHKDRLLRELQEIDALSSASSSPLPSGGEAGERGGSNPGGSNEILTPHSARRADSADPLLNALNGMLPASDRKNGVCQAADPAGAPGAPVVSGDVLPPRPSRGEGRGEGWWYCLDEVNAKSLLKDWALCRAWAEDGVQVIDGMRE